jgi:hypothetical protein
MLALLVIGAGAIVLYALFLDSSTIKLPLLVSGLAVLGICLGLLGVSLAGAAVRLGEHGRGGRALLTAFSGGLCVMGAAGALAGAIVLGILAGAA